MKANVFLIDSVNRKIVESFYSESPESKALEIAGGYFSKGEGKPKAKAKAIPTLRYPTRHGVDTPTDYFVHYLK